MTCNTIWVVVHFLGWNIGRMIIASFRSLFYSCWGSYFSQFYHTILNFFTITPLLFISDVSEVDFLELSPAGQLPSWAKLALFLKRADYELNFSQMKLWGWFFTKKLNSRVLCGFTEFYFIDIIQFSLYFLFITLEFELIVMISN